MAAFRIEHGLRRPGRSTLGLIARGIDPDRHAELFAALCEAAGPDLRPTSPGWERWHARRVAEALRAGVYALNSEDVRRIEAHAEARRLQSKVHRLMDWLLRGAGPVPAELDDLEEGERWEFVSDLNADARAAREIAGSKLTIIGPHGVRLEYDSWPV